MDTTTTWWSTTTLSTFLVPLLRVSFAHSAISSTDARPFGCADCGLLSNSKSSILRHVKRWHPERYEQIKAKQVPAWISRPDAERLQAERGDYEFPSFAEDAVHLHGLEGFATPPGTVMRDLLQLSPAPGMASQGHEVDITHHGYYGVPSSTEAPIDANLDLFLPDPYAPGASPFTLGWHSPSTSGTLFSPHGPRIDHGTTAGNDLGRFTTVHSDVTGPRSHAYHTADALAGSGDAWRSGAPSPAAAGPSTSSASQPQVLPSLTGSFNWTPLAGGMYRAGWDDSSYQNSN